MRKIIVATMMTLLLIALVAGIATAAGDENVTAVPASTPEATDTVGATTVSLESVSQLKTPVLFYPANNSNFYHYPRTTTLVWEPVTNANRYKIERGYYSGGVWAAYSVVYTASPNYTFNFVGDQKGRWRVTAQDTTNTYPASAASAWRYFYYDTSNANRIDTPVQSYPANNTIFYTYPRTTTLVWKPVLDATSYHVEIEYKSGSIWYDGIATNVTAPTYSFNFVGDQPGRWRVTAYDGAAHRESLPSAWRVFSYDTSNANRLPTPAMLYPANNTLFYNYPRLTTLVWKNVTGANNYYLETQYKSGSTWYSRDKVNTTTPYYTINFVGDQPGRWRVTAQDTTGKFRDSLTTSWRYFDYDTSNYNQLDTPVLSYPANNATFSYYPRTTTLVWKPVMDASGYFVETEFYSGGSWYDWYSANVTSLSYTFNFVGAQPGRWRVTAVDGASYQNSTPSAWRVFKYTV